MSASRARYFFLSLVPFTTAWMGQNHREALPTALYGVDLLAAGLSYAALQWRIVRADGKDSPLAKAVGSQRKEWVSTIAYASAIPLAWWSPWISDGMYVAIALLWLWPDRRIERAPRERESE